MKTINGKGVSPGVAIASIVKIEHSLPEIPRFYNSDVDEQRKKVKNAMLKVTNKTKTRYEVALQRNESEKSAIFDAHLTMLQDSELLRPVYTLIEKGLNAEAALADGLDEIVEQFKSLHDPYFAGRALDIMDLRRQIIYETLNIDIPVPAAFEQDVILVANELQPSDTADIDLQHVIGIVCAAGGETSHVVIIARSLGIAAVISQEAVEALQSGQMIVLDGCTGDIVIDPDQEMVNEVAERIAKQKRHQKHLEKYIGEKSQTADGVVIKLAANIGDVQQAQNAYSVDADEVGLFRSEFLFIASESLPSEQIQYEAYRDALLAMRGRPVVIRTLDIGADKQLSYFAQETEENPFLGKRAIRLSMANEEMFISQLRALLRAAIHGPLGVMFPMISSENELLQAIAMVERARCQLREEKIDFGKIEIGTMIEIPSAALCADALAKHCDFFSIGTNDLAAYTLAVDRGNAAVSYLYSHAHPAVLRLIKMTCQAAVKADIRCSVCGEAAADPNLQPILLGLGVQKLSMAAPSILESRARLRTITIKECISIANAALDCTSPEQVYELGKERCL